MANKSVPGLRPGRAGSPTRETRPHFKPWPPGTVVGPSSFITFVNDLPDEVSSMIYMFADDTKLYKGPVRMQIVNSCNLILIIWSRGPPNGSCYLIWTKSDRSGGFQIYLIIP